MKAPKFWTVVPALLVAGAVGLAYAKLPQPPMDEAAKAAAAAKKAKAADAAKKAAGDLAKAQDRVAERYKREKGMTTASPKMKK
ncbi:MAG TPA: hypothetical protein VGA25_11330 [Burkholderiales bacterium]